MTIRIAMAIATPAALFGDCNSDHHDADHCSKCE